MDLSKESFLVRGACESRSKWRIPRRCVVLELLPSTNFFLVHISCQRWKELWKSNELLILCINHFVSTCFLFPRWGRTKNFNIYGSCVMLVILYPFAFCFWGRGGWTFLASVVIIIGTFGSLFGLYTITKLFCSKL